MAITDWPEGERPREKLLQKGAAALSDAELLAIFLRTGVAGKSAVDLARELLNQFGSLTKLFATSEADFCAVHGMGQAKYVQLQRCWRCRGAPCKSSCSAVTRSIPRVRCAIICSYF